MRLTAVRQQFAALVTGPADELELDRAALLLAAEEYPGLAVEAYLQQLTRWADEARAHDEPQAAPVTRILRFNELFFCEWGFQGNTANYFDARNSFLSDVIERRTGIPITLTVLYMEIARRFGLVVQGVGMPGHFLAKCGTSTDGTLNDEILFDPFHQGRLLTEEDCFGLLLQLYQGALVFQRSFLDAVTPRQILVRMLQNLKGIYIRSGDHPKILGTIERIQLLQPFAPAEERDRGLVLAALGRINPALQALENYLRLAPMATDAAEIKEKMLELKRRRASLN